MAPDQLLKPRYKVIADYPKSIYPVGTIMNAGMTSQDLLYCDWDGPRMSHYPHLFKKLEWWEDREPGDLPDYIKDRRDGEVIKVTKINALYLSGVGRSWNYNALSLSYMEPATKEEYELQSASQNT